MMLKIMTPMMLPRKRDHHWFEQCCKALDRFTCLPRMDFCQAVEHRIKLASAFTDGKQSAYQLRQYTGAHNGHSKTFTSLYPLYDWLK